MGYGFFKSKVLCSMTRGYHHGHFRGIVTNPALLNYHSDDPMELDPPKTSLKGSVSVFPPMEKPAAFLQPSCNDHRVGHLYIYIYILCVYTYIYIYI